MQHPITRRPAPRQAGRARRILRRAATLGLAMAWLGLADGALAAVGKVLFVAGPVSVERGTARPLGKGDPIEVGDVVVTGEKARAQILMNDGARLALRAGTRFRIDGFALPAAVNAPARATATSDLGSSVSTLLKGGFRTATGAIGKGPGGKIDEQAYQVKTPVGTLGIRGTQYVLVWCRADCTDAPGVRPGEIIRDGLYIWVTEGAIVFRYNGGEIVGHAGEIIFIPADTLRPEQIETAPVWLQEDGAGPITLGTSGRKAPAGTGAPVSQGFNERRSPATAGQPPAGGGPGSTQPDGTVNQTVTLANSDGAPIDITNGQFPFAPNRDYAYGAPGSQQGGPGAAVSNDIFPGGGVVNASGDLTQFFGPYPGISGAAPTGTFDIGFAANAGTGADGNTGIRWGRWTGGIANFTGGQSGPVDLLTASLHWVLGPDTFIPLTLPATGTANYTLTGGTTPTDGQGNAGTLGSLTLTADFGNQTVTSALSLDINSATWTANSAAGTIGAQAGLSPTQFGGTYNVLISGQGSPGRGTFSGFFSQPAGVTTGVPGGAGLSYELQDNLGTTTVTGAAGLQQGP